MALSLLLSLMLAAEPAGPISTRTPPAPAPSVVPRATAASIANADADPLPSGAPSDDYSFVAWCDGVLSGHMDLAERVKDVLPLDDMTQKIGHAYLRAYSKALAVSPLSKNPDAKHMAETARADGWGKWEDARKAPLKLAADTYLAYQLPARCEHAAERLAHDPKLFHLAPTVDEVAAMAPAEGIGDGTLPGSAKKSAAMAKAAVAATPSPTLASLPAPVTLSKPEPARESRVMDDGGATEASAPVMAKEDVKSPPAAALADPAPAPTPAPADPTPAAQAEATPPPAAAPAPAPAQADDGKIVHMPSQGHLLPGFLRRKKPS